MKTEDLLAMTVDDCLAHLRSSPSGLSTDEAALRQKRYGMNEIAEASRYRSLAGFLGHLKNPLVIILLIAAALAMPFLPLGTAFGFVLLPPHFYLVLAGLVAGYLVTVEMVKVRFFAGRF